MFREKTVILASVLEILLKSILINTMWHPEKNLFNTQVLKHFPELLLPINRMIMVNIVLTISIIIPNKSD